MKASLLLAGVSLAAVTTLAAPLSGERFAVDLFSRWCAGGENVFFSPFSISSALAMTAAGARGETAGQIAAALDLSEGAGQLSDAFLSLDTQLAAARKDSPGLAFSVANALFPQQAFAVQPAFLETVRARFKGEAKPLDYQRDPEAARRTINTWVAEQTASRIQDLIAPGLLTPMTRMTLVNAIYFKGQWATPFDVKLTRPAPFAGTGDVTVQAPLMQRRGKMQYAEIGGIQAVDLPYAGNRFSMLVLLPAPGRPLADIAKQVKAGGLREWRAKLEETDVTLFLPRFTCTWEIECTRTLAAMGMTDLFDAGKVDLSGIAGKPGDLVVSAVVHKAFVDVAEEGTEAAAATGVVMKMTAFRPPERQVVFRADRPFAYFICEQATGCVLFAGVVVRP